MSSKNIFEVLQNIAENTESNKKFLNILKENGFTGTLEEAENQINQQTQVVLNNLTTEDLQNIAGGKSLMNDKLKKALAVGGASLMAAGTVMPSGSALNMANVKDKFKEYTDKGSKYIGKHPIHSTTTAALALIAGTLIIKNIFQGRPNEVLSSNEDLLPYLYEKDLSKNQNVLNFIFLCATGNCTITVGGKGTAPTLQFTNVKDDFLKGKLWDDEQNNPTYTIDTLLETFVSLMAEDGDYRYVTNDNNLTTDGAAVLNDISKPIRNLLNCVIKNAKTSVEKESNEEDKVKQEDDQYQTAVTEAETNLNTFRENKTKLDAFITALLTHVNGLLDKVNKMDIANDRVNRKNEVKKFTDESSNPFEQAWNGFTNVADLKTAGILTEEIKNAIKDVVVSELNKLATNGEQSAELASIEETIKAAIEAKLNTSFETQETQLQNKVDQAKAAQQSASKPNANPKKTTEVAIELPQARHFEGGETLTLKQAALKDDDQ